ncbi:hypothetical protein CRUP_005814 [Coryphaenoides rupestris]|nr:hypothetical protein CRUP_005814 [Coryphaenoides rupestris]
MFLHAVSTGPEWKRCVFLPDNGSFFVNYVIASAFIGNAMDLLRIPGLLMYMIRLCLARSVAERRNVKRHQRPTSSSLAPAYAWMMCVFTVVMTYSITCPIIVPFGLMYMLLKHLADRYNMYYAYLPSKPGQEDPLRGGHQVVAAPSSVSSGCSSSPPCALDLPPATSMFTFVVLIITIHHLPLPRLLWTFQVPQCTQLQNRHPGCGRVENGVTPRHHRCQQRQHYGQANRRVFHVLVLLQQHVPLLRLLQDPNADEVGRAARMTAGLLAGRGASFNVTNGLNEDFQSGEDSLI